MTTPLGAAPGMPATTRSGEFGPPPSRVIVGGLAVSAAVRRKLSLPVPITPISSNVPCSRYTVAPALAAAMPALIEALATLQSGSLGFAGMLHAPDVSARAYR